MGKDGKARLSLSKVKFKRKLKESLLRIDKKMVDFLPSFLMYDLKLVKPFLAEGDLSRGKDCLKFYGIKDTVTSCNFTCHR